MRGRSLFREPSGLSLCAFCAHRLGAARQASHVQRRFLHSSGTALKPPAEGAALREDDDDRGFTPQQSRPPAPSWGRPATDTGNGFGPVSNWGRPAFVGGIPQNGPAGSWGRPSTDSTSITAEDGLTQVGRSNYAAGASDLLPHEQRARELMLERENRAQRRQVKIHAGPGPRSSRAGRPEPYSETERLAKARSQLERKKARDLQDQRTQMLNAGGFTIRRPYDARHSFGDREPTRPTDQESGDLPQWSQLRRRAEEAPPNQPKALEDTFSEGRAQREEQAKSARYTPLGSRSIFSAQEGDTTHPSSLSNLSQSRQLNPGAVSSERSDRHSQSQFKISRGFGPTGGSFTRDTQVRDPSTISDVRTPVGDWPGRGRFLRQTSISDRSSKPQPFQSFTRSTSATLDVEQKEAPRSQLKERKEEEDEDREERENRRKKRTTRVASEGPSYEAIPKGKAREKAKRRQQFVEEGDEEDAEREAAAQRAELKRQRKRAKAAKKAAAPTPLLLPEYISVSNLAVALKVRYEDFVEKMEDLGFEETNHDHILNAENAGLIAMEYNYEAIVDRGESEDLKPRAVATDPSKLPQRPPVVTIMGHVDHGKTTLLDWLRKSSVAATEHGGITQHIGAFSVPMPSGKVITFLDTPGHAAFLSMRQRGANVTDIVILVVAADDSVKPQTIEAINHAKAAKVPIIVAINKIDKEEANIDRVKQDLARHGVDVEDFGGDTQVVCVSGKTGQGMNELEEAAVTLSEILDMRAETDGQAEGWILEASIKPMGKVATVLVRRGTMRPGDFIVAGKTWARIRCMRSEAGVDIEAAGPGTPVEIDGWREQPLAGDEVLQAPDEAKAKSVIEYRLEKEERDKMAEDMEAINEHRKAEQEKRERERAEALSAAAQEDGEAVVVETPLATVNGPKLVYFIVKGDVSGSVEAVIDSISPLGNKEVQPLILRSGVGQLSEFDIEHAAAAKGHLINFNTVVESNISRLAEESKVSIINHNIIYRLVDDVKAELSKHLPPLVTQRVLGEAEIAQIFEITVKGRQQKAIAGCKVRNGAISKTAKVRVLRDGEKVFDGTLASLKNAKKDVAEMKRGGECGMGFENWVDFRVGDHVQAYEEKEEKRYL